MTARQLLNRHREHQDWMQAGSSNYFFNQSKIKQFYNDYRGRIESIEGEIDKLRHEYFVYEEEKIKTEKNERGGDVPVMNEGKTMDQWVMARETVLDQFIPDKV